MEHWVLALKGSVPLHLSIQMEDGSRDMEQKWKGMRETRIKCRKTINRLTRKNYAFSCSRTLAVTLDQIHGLAGRILR